MEGLFQFSSFSTLNLLTLTFHIVSLYEQFAQDLENTAEYNFMTFKKFAHSMWSNLSVDGKNEVRGRRAAKKPQGHDEVLRKEKREIKKSVST